MPFLTLSGFTIPVLASSNGTISMVNVGEYGRTFSGAPYSAVRARGEEYQGRWPLSPRTTGAIYKAIILGMGSSWRFATSGLEAYSTKGLGPSVISGTPAYSATGGPVSSGPRLLLDTTERISYETGLTALNGGATLSLWIKSASTSSTWRNYVIESDGTSAIAAWQNGVSISVASLPNNLDDAWLPLAESGFQVWLGNLTGANQTMEVAEVMLFPFRVSLVDSTWPTWPYNGGAGRAAEDFPYLTMGGSWPASGSDVVLGEVGKQDLVDVLVGGVQQIYASGEFTLRSSSLTP
jgi:hypothetical protein